MLGGRTSAGRRAALSHTAALAADDAVRDAALRQAGVVRVRTGLQALDAARALSGQPVPSGRRVAVITNSGGTGVELTDLLADQGLLLPELSQPLQDQLRAIMPGYASARNPVDMTPAWQLFGTVYPAAIELLARSGEVDVVMPVLLQRSASAEVAAAVRDAVLAAAGRFGTGAGLRLLGGGPVRRATRGPAPGRRCALLCLARAHRGGGWRCGAVCAADESVARRRGGRLNVRDTGPAHPARCAPGRDRATGFGSHPVLAGRRRDSGHPDGAVL